MCNNPKWIYKKGFYKENNYRGYKGQAYEIGTYTKCGACSICLAEKANNWVVRNHYESKSQEKKCFITLTYKENPYILIRKDLQDFIKRFRFEINKEYYKKLNNVKKGLKGDQLKSWKEDHENEFIKTRIFYAGEYGTAKGRPHFHVIIYGWEDENIEYLDINKKWNILYKSPIIEKVWGLGRTTYQKFGDKEIPYITLYNTAQEEFKRAYKITFEKAKQIENIIKNKPMDEGQKKNLQSCLYEIKDWLDTQKEKYYLIKEFNGWSIALGWEEFEKQYNKSDKYAFVEYVENCEFVTPSPWVKKLANLGDIQAKEEMLRRENLIIQSANETEESQISKFKEQQRRKKERLEWQEKGRKNGEIDEL